MKILLTGATGYIGKRLLPELLKEGHEVICSVRDKKRFDTSIYSGNLKVVESNFLFAPTLKNIPDDIDAAFYLIHSMSASTEDFDKMEYECARNFNIRISQTRAKQVIYLSGISNHSELSSHLQSRFNVEEALKSTKYALTVLRAGIIVGSGSASFEIIRDLVEKLPVMIAPKWLNTPSQPIAVKNVVQFLNGVLGDETTYNDNFDIGGREVLTYKQMLLHYASVRGLKRGIYTVPVMTPKISSYWLYYVTSTSYKLAINLVNSMKVPVIARYNSLATDYNIKLISYKRAIQLAFDKIDQHQVMSSWTDALSSKTIEDGMESFMNVPSHGCLTDAKESKINDEVNALQKIWSIGGENGWYYANALWRLRGFIDKIVGGVGLRRGRKNKTDINQGESLDFWRVIYASKSKKRMLLYAEMKLPGEAWLEFKVSDNKVYQTATFRPKGVFGRLYWYALLPIHKVIFQGMINNLVKV